MTSIKNHFWNVFTPQSFTRGVREYFLKTRKFTVSRMRFGKSDICHVGSLCQKERNLPYTPRVYFAKRELIVPRVCLLYPGRVPEVLKLAPPRRITAKQILILSFTLPRRAFPFCLPLRGIPTVPFQNKQERFIGAVETFVNTVEM